VQYNKLLNTKIMNVDKIKKNAICFFDGKILKYKYINSVANFEAFISKKVNNAAGYINYYNSKTKVYMFRNYINQSKK